MKLLIGIPAYNEEHSIMKVLSLIPMKIPGIHSVDVIVVNDGSTDRTAEVVKRRNVMVISHVMNRGLGAALKTIFEYAKSKKYDFLITLDADGQHDPKYILSFLALLTQNNTDVIVGTRWITNSSAPISRKLINQAANLLTFLFSGIVSTDSQSGYRAFSKNAIQKIELISDGMEVSSEFYKQIAEHKLAYKEIPIKAIYTKYSLSKGQRLSNAPYVLGQLIVRILQ